MKALTQYINEYLIKKKIDKVHGGYKYTPKTKEELINNIKELLDQGDTNLNCIDVSNITDMSEVFVEVNEICLNEIKEIDVSEWDVSNVKNMHAMFLNCYNFEGKGLENWDVSNVEDMDSMFFECKKFNCDLSNWNVSNVEYMNSMFMYCYNFIGKGLKNWDVSNVKNMHSMFFGCKKFEGKDIENWNVSNVKDMKFMFINCFTLNCELSRWNVSNVIYMSKCF